MSGNPDSGPGRIEFRADDRSLTPYAGLAVSGELCRGLRLVELIDAELRAVDRVAPVKRRRRGLSAGGVAVAISEAQLVGAECFDDIEDVRADEAGAELRAGGQAPSASTARQLSYRFKTSHIHAIERAAARCGNELDRRLGREAGEDVSFDLDATETVVYGRRKRGTGRSRNGQLAYNSYAVTWAQRGRALTSELKGGNQARIKASQSLTLIARAERLLPTGHGEVTVRGDSGFYAVELMVGLRKRKMRFTLSATRTSLMWAKLAEIQQDTWEDAIDMRGAQVAELPFTPQGWTHEPLRLVVRRVPVTAAALEATSPRARGTKDDPSRATADGARRTARLDVRIQLHRHRHPRAAEEHRGGRALPPPPCADRGAIQGRKARASAQAPPLREPQRQPPVAGLLTVSPEHNRLGVRHQPRRVRVGQRAQGHPPAPPRQNATTAPVLRARPNRPHRPADHRAPPRRLPALRDLQRDLPRRAGAPRPVARRPARPGRPSPAARETRRPHKQSPALSRHPSAAIDTHSWAPVTTSQTPLTISHPH